MAQKAMGPVCYYVCMDAKSIRGDKPPMHCEFGPYATCLEAEMKKIEQKEAVGTPDYEYEYRIETRPVPPITSK